jgi:excisionase family DNA binding protein
MDGPLTYTVAEAAELFGVSRDSIYKAIREGKFKALRFGRRTVIPRIEVDQLLGITNGHEAA